MLSTPLSFPAKPPTLPSWMNSFSSLNNLLQQVLLAPTCHKQGQKTQRSLSYCGAQDSNPGSSSCQICSSNPSACCLGSSLHDGPARLHIMGPSSAVGHAGPGWTWWGEEETVRRALTELGFGSQLSSRFGCSWGPCSWREKEVGQGCHPW